jgi:hypothetical protein
MAHVATVTIDSDQVPADATNFPAYINLAHLFAGSESFASTVANGGGDIRVFQGATELAREVVSCDTSAETGELHVLIPFLDSSADTVLSIYADGSSADYAVDDPFGRNSVWSTFSHKQIGGDDATGSSTLTLSGNTALSGTVNGFDALDFDGNAIAKSLATFSGTASDDWRTNDITLSAWVNADSVSAARAHIIAKRESSIQEFALRLDNANPEFLSGGTAPKSSGSISVSTDAHLVVTRIGGNVNFYINGAFVDAVSVTNSPSISSGDLSLGGPASSTTASDYFNGRIALAGAINGTALSPQWITTEYNNQSDPSLFYTATDPNAGGGVSVAVPAASVTITGYAPTVTGEASISVDVPVGEISVTGYAPTVTSTDNIEVAIPADSLTVTGYAPTVTASDSQEVSPGADSIAVTGYAPTIAITDAQAIVIPAGSVTVTGYAPSVETTSNVTVEVDTGSVSITGHAPAVGTSISVSPAVSTLSITGYAPAVVASVKTVTCTLVDVNGRALPNLSDLSYAWFDEPDPANLSTPVVKGVTESTDGSGVIEVPISGSSLTSGQTGLLVLRSSDGESLGAYNLPVA